MEQHSVPLDPFYSKGVLFPEYPTTIQYHNTHSISRHVDASSAADYLQNGNTQESHPGRARGPYSAAVVPPLGKRTESPSPWEQMLHYYQALSCTSLPSSVNPEMPSHIISACHENEIDPDQDEQLVDIPSRSEAFSVNPLWKTSRTSDYDSLDDGESVYSSLGTANLAGTAEGSRKENAPDVAMKTTTSVMATTYGGNCNMAASDFSADSGYHSLDGTKHEVDLPGIFRRPWSSKVALRGCSRWKKFRWNLQDRRVAVPSQEAQQRQDWSDFVAPETPGQTGCTNHQFRRQFLIGMALDCATLLVLMDMTAASRPLCFDPKGQDLRHELYFSLPKMRLLRTIVHAQSAHDTSMLKSVLRSCRALEACSKGTALNGRLMSRAWLAMTDNRLQALNGLCQTQQALFSIASPPSQLMNREKTSPLQQAYHLGNYFAPSLIRPKMTMEEQNRTSSRDTNVEKVIHWLDEVAAAETSPSSLSDAGIETIISQASDPAAGMSTNESASESSSGRSDFWFESDGEASFVLGEDSESSTNSAECPKFANDASQIAARLVAIYSEGKRRPEGPEISSQSSSAPGATQQTSDNAGLSSITSHTFFSRQAAKQRQRPDDEDDGIRRRKVPKGLNEQSDANHSKLLACPYAKFDPTRYSEQNTVEKQYRGCSSCYLRDISRLKQHFYRVHRRPEHHCPICFSDYDSKEALDAHLVERSCEARDSPFPEKMTPAQFKKIKRRQPNKSREELWFEIYETLFPGSPRPLSPYNDGVHAAMLQDFARFLNVDARAALGLEIERRMFPPMLSSPENRAFRESVYDQAISVIVQQFESRFRQAASPEAEEVSNSE